MFDRIHHAGLAVADLAVAKRVFADALGLIEDPVPGLRRASGGGGGQQRGSDPTDILDIPIGNSELELNAPPTDGTPAGGTGRFIETRGGVGALHHICLHSTNVPDDVAHLRASGLTQIAAPPDQIASEEPWRTVSFFHPRDCLGVLLEIWPTDNHRVGDGNQGAGIFTRLNHIGVLTDDLEKARHFWCNVIGLRVDTLRSPIVKGGRLIDSGRSRVLNIPVGADGGEIVAIAPQAADTGTAQYLAKWGGRAGGTMHHVGLATRDVRAAADFVQSNGLKLIGPANDDFAWIHPQNAGGVLIEIVRDTR
jgi:catechol 2,3-dioxygenase-like lactoylglutathione lyase family enzyme